MTQIDTGSMAAGKYEDIIFTIDENLAEIRLNRPESLNALTFKMIAEIVDAIETCAQHDQVRAVLLTASGTRAFSAGYDLKQMGEPFSQPTHDLYLRAEQRVDRIERAITALPKPVIVAARGHVIGSGLDIVLSCDYSLCSDTAKFSESRVFRANMATVHWLPLYVGWAKAREMIYRGEAVNGQEAVRIGLINRSVPDMDLDEEALRLAHEFAAGPTVALGLYKRALNRQVRDQIADGEDLRNVYGLLLKNTDDISEAKRAFREKRKPHFTGT